MTGPAASVGVGGQLRPAVRAIAMQRRGGRDAEGWSLECRADILSIRAAAKPAVTDQILEHDLTDRRRQAEQPRRLIAVQTEAGHFPEGTENHRDELRP